MPIRRLHDDCGSARGGLQWPLNLANDGEVLHTNKQDDIMEEVERLAMSCSPKVKSFNIKKLRTERVCLLVTNESDSTFIYLFEPLVMSELLQIF
ncbi:hypothetical protein NOR_07049 [Metarhizium rileyi]|uniref:Uncharacterized protein n=1 Tax=Metarhizium rileyi (strain RCEF 4871) TaxID=1649241 RepID=A0A166Z961_METRR|nr:hypothetical protein NOR_07049 [Metarhizium rileyi RCEF 4871]